MAGKGREDTIKTTISVDGEKEYKNACKQISGALKELGSEMKLVDAQFAENADGAEALTKKQDILNKEIVEYEKKLSAAEKTLREMEESGEGNEDAMRRMRIEINRAKTSIANTQTELKQMERALESNADEANDAENEFKDLAKAAGQLDGSLDDAGDELDGFADALGNLGGPLGDAADMLGGIQDKLGSLGISIPGLISPMTVGIAALGTALGAAAVESVKFAAEVDGALTGFSNKTGIAAKDSDEFKDALFDVYKYGLGESVEDVANAMAVVAQATGEVNPDKIGELARAAMTLEKTFDMDVAESIRSAQQLMNTFGESGMAAFDTIAKASQLGLDKDGNLLDVINEYAVHYKQLGLDMDDMFNSLINAKEAGVFDLSYAGEAIKEFGIRVREGSDETKAALKDLGLNAKEVISAINKGGPEAAEAMQLVVDALNGIEDPIERNRIGIALFGTAWEDLGATGVAAATNMTGALGETNGTIDAINEKNFDTIEGAADRFGATVQSKIIEPIGDWLGTWLPDAINAASDAIETATNGLGEFAKGMGALLKGPEGMEEFIVEEPDFSKKLTFSSADYSLENLDNLKATGYIGIMGNPSEVAQQYVAGVKAALGITTEGGGASATIPVGESVMAGIATGYNNEAPNTEQALLDIASGMVTNAGITMKSEAPAIGETADAGIANGLFKGKPNVDGAMVNLMTGTITRGASMAEVQGPGIGTALDTSLSSGIDISAPIVIGSVDSMMLTSVDAAGAYGPQFNAAGAQVPDALQSGMAPGMAELESWLRGEMGNLSWIAKSGLADINAAVSAAQAAVKGMPNTSGSSGGTSVTQNFYGVGSGGMSTRVRDARLEAQILARGN